MKREENLVCEHFNFIFRIKEEVKSISGRRVRKNFHIREIIIHFSITDSEKEDAKDIDRQIQIRVWHLPIRFVGDRK